MSGTNFRSGVCVRKQYSGSAVPGDKSKHAAATKLIKKSAVIRCDAQNIETLTNFTLPPMAAVRDVMINIITPEAGITIDVGASGGVNNNSTGFLAAVNGAVAGLVKGDLVDGGVTLGVYLYEETGVGADVAYGRHADITSGNHAITYTCLGGATSVVFDIMVDYDEVVVEVQ